MTRWFPRRIVSAAAEHDVNLRISQPHVIVLYSERMSEGKAVSAH